MKNWFKKESRFYHLFVDIPSLRLRNKIVNILNSRVGSKILDVATGTGGQAFAFAKRGYDVIGIDLSEDMVNIASNLNKYENLKFKVADATCIPFEDNYFDVSNVSLALHDMPLAIREKTVEEMTRVTKSKGIIAIFDYALPKNKIWRHMFYLLMKAHETKYYPKFVVSDFKALLRKNRIKIKKEIPLMFGGGKIWMCINEK